MEIFHTVVNWCMPLALLMHMWSSFVTFGVTFSWYDAPDNQEILEVQEQHGTNRFFSHPLHFKLRSDVLTAFGVFWTFSVVFIVAFMLPLKIWNFQTGESFGCGTQLHRRITIDQTLSNTQVDDILPLLPKDLSYSAALEAMEDQHAGRENILNRICRIEVSKYIPDPTRREFGLMFVN
jgi:hypothetical protein